MTQTTTGPNGKLTPEQRGKLERHINAKTSLIGKCPTCGQRAWGLLDHLVHLPIFYPGGSLVVGGPAYPNVGLVCGNCGNTQLINAMVSGVLGGGQQPEPSSEDEAP